MDIDFSCSVDKCFYMCENGSPYCPSHRHMFRKYGTPTPLVECYYCEKSFVWKPISRKTSKWYRCDKCIELLREHNHLLPEKAQHHRLTRPEHLKMFMAQNFRCKICREKKKLYVDHDHSCCPFTKGSCGKCIRGLLCSDCNISLGYYEKHYDLHERFDEYLSASKVSA